MRFRASATPRSSGWPRPAARRAAEEQRLAQAAEARRQEEPRSPPPPQAGPVWRATGPSWSPSDRRLLAEIARLRQAASVAKAAVPALRPRRWRPRRRPPSRPRRPSRRPRRPTLTPARAVVSEVAPAAATGRPRSITLRAPSRIQRIDFVDEPAHSSVIVELDEPSMLRAAAAARRPGQPAPVPGRPARRSWSAAWTPPNTWAR